MNVTHVDNEIDLWVAVDAGYESRRLDGLAGVGRAHTIRRVAVDGDGERVIGIRIDRRPVLRMGHQACGQPAPGDNHRDKSCPLHLSSLRSPHRAASAVWLQVRLLTRSVE